MEKELTSYVLNEQTSVLADESYGGPAWDVETLVAQIMDDLGDGVSQTAVKQVVLEILPQYENVKVKNFAPIFIRKEAVNRLR